MLNVQPWYFNNSADSLPATPEATLGTNFTAGANNADGAAVAVLPALAFDACYLVIGITGVNASTADGNALADILIDPAGGTSWGSFIDDLTCGMTTNPGNTNAMDNYYHFPLWVPAGAALGVRARTAHTADLTNGRCVIWAFGNPSKPEMWWCGQAVESLGINAASSKGTDVTGAAAPNYGSWTNIGSPTSARYGAVQLGVNGSDDASSATAYHWQIGHGSQPLPGCPTMQRGMGTAESGAHFGRMPIWCDIPAGTQMQARMKVATEVFNCAIYGVY